MTALHLFISTALAVAGGLVAAAFGVSAGMSALVGLIIFGIYWGVCVICVNLDDLF